MPERNAAGLYETHIDGHTYEFGKWPAEDSLETLVDLAAVVGGSLGPAAVHAYLEGVRTDFDRDTLDKVCSHLAAQLTQNRTTVIRVIKRLGAHHVTCDGRPVVFAAHYQERMLHCFRVVRAALEVQYGDFFGGLFTGAPPPLGAQASRATATSTGSSGGP